jgi:hypothetical protein
MSKDFIPYQEALELKELGFDESCFGKYDVYGVFDHILFYHNHDVETEYVGCSAPLYQQAFRWFRKSENGSLNHLDFMYEYLKDDSMSYEEVELECVKKLIEIVKNKGGDK